MLTSENTQVRILDLLKRGAKLAYHYRHHHDGDPTLVRITLDHHDKSLTLSHWEHMPGGTPPFSEDGPRVRIHRSTTDTIIGHADIREGYPGYTSDHARTWRKVYKHKTTPKPWWVEKQVSWNENGQLE